MLNDLEKLKKNKKKYFKSIYNTHLSTKVGQAYESSSLYHKISFYSKLIKFII